MGYEGSLSQLPKKIPRTGLPVRKTNTILFKNSMKNRIALTSIVQDTENLYTYLLRKKNEQMGLIVGDPGLGKTTACKYLEEYHPVIYCSVLPTWTPTQMVNWLLFKACGEKRRGLTRAMSALLNHLHHSGQALIFDESERLCNRHHLLDTVRTIHDNSSVPILLVGMGRIKEKLEMHRHFYDRCAGFIYAQKPSFSDIKLAVGATTNIPFSKELLNLIVGDPSIGNNYRRVRTSVEYIAKELRDRENHLPIAPEEWTQPYLPYFARQEIYSNVAVEGFGS